MKTSPSASKRTEARSIESCGSCAGRVALVRPSATIPAMPWRCRQCGVIYLAAPERRNGSVFRGGVTPAIHADVFPQNLFDGERAELSTEDVRQLKLCLPASECRASDVRRAPRHLIATPISVIAIEEDFGVAGPPATAYTIDVSSGGLSILHPEPTTAPYFAVDFALSQVEMPTVIFKPIRCSRLGSAYAVAGAFVCRVEF